MSPLSVTEQAEAKELYRKWFGKHPDIANPSDINRKEKHDMAKVVSWETLQLMQKARKSNVKKYGYPHPWTHARYWKKLKGENQ